MLLNLFSGHIPEICSTFRMQPASIHAVVFVVFTADHEVRLKLASALAVQQRVQYATVIELYYSSISGLLMTSTRSHILDAKESARYHRSLLLLCDVCAILPLLCHFIVVDDFGVWIRHIQYLIKSRETEKLIVHHLLEFEFAT